MRARVLCISIFYSLTCLNVLAGNGEKSRILVHTLNYIGHDYQYAVKDGKVISEPEYKEAMEFAAAAKKYFKLYSTDWNKSDSASIGGLIGRLDSLVAAKGTFSMVSALANEAELKIILASGLQIVPTEYPNLETGKIVFRTECAKCHGNSGIGDGPEGVGLDPKPRNFLDDERMRTISPFTAFNTIRLGIEGTGMKPHPMLEDEEVWDVAFYITSLRYQPLSDHPFLKEEGTRNLLEQISLQDIADKSDEEFFNSIKINDSVKLKLMVAAIRLNQENSEEGQYIKTSLKYLDGAMELYLQGKYSEASQLAMLSYLEGIEPIEKQLRASDPDLMIRLEGQMQHVRRMMEQKHDALAVSDSVHAVRATISQANELLGEKKYSFWLALFMAASVLLREGLEAFLVIMVILSILKATQLKNSVHWVHLGWIAAVMLGIVLWLIGGQFMKIQAKHMEIVEGAISFIAVCMLLYVGFWLHGKSEITKWKDYVGKMMKGVVGRESVWGLAALSFFVVFREVFESVLFLSALNIESGGKQSDAIVLGVLSAFTIVLVLAYVFMKFATQLPIPKLFKISSFVMGVLAIVLVGKGVHSFQEIGLVAIHGLPMIRIELLGVFPTIETCGAQLLVLGIVIAIWKITVSPKR